MELHFYFSFQSHLPLPRFYYLLSTVFHIFSVSNPELYPNIPCSLLNIACLPHKGSVQFRGVIDWSGSPGGPSVNGTVGEPGINGAPSTDSFPGKEYVFA